MQIEQEGISAVHCWKQTRERPSSRERESASEEREIVLRGISFQQNRAHHQRFHTKSCATTLISM